MIESIDAKQPDKETRKGIAQPAYEPPAIVYESLITTRAGSPTGATDSDGSDVDPADLFGG